MDYYSSPRWTAEIADCSMPMTMDTYSNCSYKCIYCFSQFQRGIGEGKEKYLNNEVKWVNPENFKKIWEHPESSQFGPYVKAGKTMQWGGLSDQFDENERKYGKTLEMLRWLRKIIQTSKYPSRLKRLGGWMTLDILNCLRTTQIGIASFQLLRLKLRKPRLLRLA